MHRALATLLVFAALLGVPGTALAQSAGDDQYTDPFQGGEPAPEQPQSDPTPEQPATPPTTSGEGLGVVEGGDGAAQPAQTTDAPALPRTGLPVLAVLIGGAMLLGTGAALRRRC
jgi:hypothetical protein